jgi:hypothetical protein
LEIEGRDDETDADPEKETPPGPREKKREKKGKALRGRRSPELGRVQEQELEPETGPELVEHKGTGRRQLNVNIVLKTLDDGRSFSVPATLVDSGVTDYGIIDADYVRENQINAVPLETPITTQNADGTPNAAGQITHYVPFRMKIGSHEETLYLLITKIATNKVYLGHEWLALHDPEISWKEKTIKFTRCPKQCRQPVKVPSVSSVPNYLAEYPQVFSEAEFQTLPPHSVWDHEVNLKEGQHTVNEKLYSLSREERKTLDEWLDENLKSGRIRPSTSEFATPCFFRHDPKTRLCHDYRKLNAVTIKNRYPLPRIRDLVDRLQGAKIFTKLDVRWGYNNVRIREGDEHKLAFITHRGLFEPLVMMFGPCNAPSTFQKLMNEVLREEIKTGKVQVYMDDIIIFTETLEEHREMVRRVLQRLAEANLFLKPEKCEFERAEIQFLGMIISHNNIKMAPKKVESITQWPTPKNKKQVQKFLGLANYYRRFIKGFAHIAKALHKLTGNHPWTWEAEQRRAFAEVKDTITTAPVLQMPDEDKPFRLETDASAYAIGAVLSQQGEDNLWRPVEFFSRTMNPAERNYQIYDQEMLAVIEAIREWRQYLLGSNVPFEVWTDHLNLTYYRKPQNLSKRQARWVSELGEYEFTIHYLPGKLNSKADALSRRPDYAPDEEDNVDIVGLPESRFRPVNIGSDDTERHEEILREHHDTPIAGHPGIERTRKSIERHYNWPTLKKDVEDYVKGCQTCQRTKAIREKKHAPLHPNEIPTRPWEVISWDLIGPLPESNGFNAILVVVDRYTKLSHEIPTNTDLTAEGTARLFRDNVFKHHGLPRIQ